MAAFVKWAWFRALPQNQFEVTVRKAGCRFLSAPKPVQPYAAKDWECAWLAAAAYSKTPDAARRRALAPTEESPELPGDRLQAAGWTRWTEFPTEEMHRETFDQTHLRVEVWEKNEPSTIAVTFGGTVFWNEMDWRANLRWFLPKHRDEYSDVVQRFAPAFLEQLIRWLGPRPPETVRLISTGHSLGGGLAQQFAYAHCLDPRVPRVAAVYAFDPSPVTGFFSVKKSVRDVNRKTLAIDRIYERGEILAIVRSITSVLWRPSKTAPTIRGTRYFLFFAWNPIAGHSMVRMATKMDTAARHGLQ